MNYHYKNTCEFRLINPAIRGQHQPSRGHKGVENVSIKRSPPPPGGGPASSAASSAFPPPTLLPSASHVVFRLLWPTCRCTESRHMRPEWSAAEVRGGGGSLDTHWFQTFVGGFAFLLSVFPLGTVSLLSPEHRAGTGGERRCCWEQQDWLKATDLGAGCRGELGCFCLGVAVDPLRPMTWGVRRLGVPVFAVI